MTDTRAIKVAQEMMAVTSLISPARRYGGPPEDHRFHQVRGTAGEDEGREQPEDGAERQVFLAENEEAEDASDGEISRT